MDCCAGARGVRGLLFGLILFVVSQSVAMPALGLGVLGAGTFRPVLLFMGGLLQHLSYAVVLGGIAGPQAQRGARRPGGDRHDGRGPMRFNSPARPRPGPVSS
ncbi:MAG: hypothetical protein HYS04_10540 [Acidobacteria bacterium]|nr:hypothetical protein [Acidobacteriota bacterium]